MMVMVMVVRRRTVMMMVMRVVMVGSGIRSMMVMMMMVFGTSPFAVIWPPLVAETPRAATFGRGSIGSAVSRIALTIFGGDSEFSAFVMMVMSMGWSWRIRGSQVMRIGSFFFAFSWAIFSAESPRAAALRRWTVWPESAFVPTAFALVRGDTVFAAIRLCWLGRGRVRLFRRFAWNQSR